MASKRPLDDLEGVEVAGDGSGLAVGGKAEGVSCSWCVDGVFTPGSAGGRSSGRAMAFGIELMLDSSAVARRSASVPESVKKAGTFY